MEAHPEAKPNEPVSNIIPEQVVAAVCREVEEYSAEQVRDFVSEAAASQPTAYAFASPFLEAMSPHGLRLAAYLLAVIVRMFQMHFGKRLQIVNPPLLEPIFKKNAKLIDGLLGRDKHVSARADAELGRDQPWVWRFTAAHLLESDHPNINLSKRDKGELALLLKTVIDALNNSIRPIR